MILYTLDTNHEILRNHKKKTLIVYSFFTIFCLMVNKIYSLFGHGVSSDAMTYMFLFPLIGGVVFYLFIFTVIIKDNKPNGYRLFYNIYNSGIATLAIGSFLKGILEIAGTNSKYVSFYNIVGSIFIALSLLLFIFTNVKNKKSVH